MGKRKESYSAGHSAMLAALVMLAYLYLKLSCFLNEGNVFKSGAEKVFSGEVSLFVVAAVLDALLEHRG